MDSVKEAETIVGDIEHRLKDAGVDVPAPPTTHLPKLRIRARSHTPFSAVLTAMFKTYRMQTFVGLSLMIAQAFLYNGVNFTYGLVLLKQFNVPSAHIGLYLAALRRHKLPRTADPRALLRFSRAAGR